MNMLRTTFPVWCFILLFYSCGTTTDDNSSATMKDQQSQGSNLDSNLMNNRDSQDIKSATQPGGTGNAANIDSPATGTGNSSGGTVQEGDSL